MQTVQGPIRPLIGSDMWPIT